MQKPPTRAELQERQDAAWRHYWIGMRSFGMGLPTDWEYLLFKVMCCLTPRGEEAGYEAVQEALDELGEVDDLAPVRRPVKYTRHP